MNKDKFSTEGKTMPRAAMLSQYADWTRERMARTLEAYANGLHDMVEKNMKLARKLQKLERQLKGKTK